MMKKKSIFKTFLIAIATILGSHAFAQKEGVTSEKTEDGGHQLVFKDGTRMNYTFLKGDADTKPIWSIYGGAFSGFDENQMFFGFTLSSLIDIKKIQLRGELDHSYPFSLTTGDPNSIPNADDKLSSEQRWHNNLSIYGGFQVWEDKTMKATDIPLRTENKGGMSVVYTLKQDLPVSRSVYVEGGVMQLTRSIDKKDRFIESVETVNPSLESGVFLTNLQMTMLRVGASYQTNRFGAIVLDNKLYAYSAGSRVYAHLLLPVVGPSHTGLYQITGNPFVGEFGFETQKEPFDEADLSEELSLTNFGFLLGVEAYGSLGGSNVGKYKFAIEAGVLPGLSDVQYSNLYVGVRIAYGFGAPMFKQ
ncbi:MAG: hypothetical protein LAT54_00690 [Cryomorphaceae bacterium]|nr:hypothetical protein [Cryomorphaceae bacterium]